jgi:Mg/Co/Ni transporter MgtE
MITELEGELLLLVAGIAVFIVTAIVFWMFLPRHGKLHRFADTEWEPYIGVAFTSAVALSLTMMLSAVLGMIG